MLVVSVRDDILHLVVGIARRFIVALEDWVKDHLDNLASRRIQHTRIQLADTLLGWRGLSLDIAVGCLLIQRVSQQFDVLPNWQAKIICSSLEGV